MAKRILSIIRLLASTRFLARRLERKFVLAEIVRGGGQDFDRVADVGCGKAPYKNLVSCKQYIGVDIEDRGGVSDIILANINNGIPLPDDHVDLVICTETLEHTQRPHFVVGELMRIVKPGGRVILTTPMVWPIHEAPYDFFRFTNFGLESLFAEAGATHVHTEPSNGYFYSICILLLLYMRHWVLAPIVIIVNLTGLVFYRFERNRDLAILQQIVAYK